MEWFGYVDNGPIGINNNGLLEPIQAKGRSLGDTTGLGFKKVPFHLGINKFVQPEHQSAHEVSPTAESLEETSDEDTFPYPIPLDLATLFAEPDSFVPCIGTTETDSDSDETASITHFTTEQWREIQTCNPDYQGELYTLPHLQM
jgi:hypothetical protein